ncbi:Reverse transcriptase zinc-binding domain [Sesbania bispinosa]|nr:Reverse transcriptase zinc-binding domain [Sesbania bispinosa]
MPSRADFPTNAAPSASLPDIEEIKQSLFNMVAYHLSDLLEIPKAADLGLYLAFPTLHSRPSKETYAFIVDKVRKKLSGWKANSLSFEGRRKCHLVSWDKICKPIAAGGLGFRSLKTINEAYMLKLAWNIIASPDLLWVKVLRAKYRVEDHAKPSVSTSNRSSILWKNIVKSRSHLDRCCCSIIGNGGTVRFWKDSFIPNMGPLINHSHGIIPPCQIDLPVASFVSNGSWNWDLIEEYLSLQGRATLASIKPPIEDVGPDSPAWLLSANGEFSTKSAYEYILGSASPPMTPDSVFKKIWQWQGPPRISSFLWKVLHGRLLTNSERKKRGMSPSDSRPRCGNASETILHTLRDCEVVADLWSSLIDQNNWASFFSLGLDNWMKKNLLDISINVAGTPWSFIFPVAVWLIWKDRNNLIFNSKTDLPSNLFFRIISHARRIISTIASPCPISQRIFKNKVLISWARSPQGFIKLNVDGSVLEHSYIASCGGLFRNEDGDFIDGFKCNIGFCSSVKTELEANRVTDHLANLGHDIPIGIEFLTSPPRYLIPILSEDLRGQWSPPRLHLVTASFSLRCRRLVSTASVPPRLHCVVIIASSSPHHRLISITSVPPCLHRVGVTSSPLRRRRFVFTTSPPHFHYIVAALSPPRRHCTSPLCRLHSTMFTSF